MKLKLLFIAVAVIGFLCGFQLTPKAEPMLQDPALAEIRAELAEIRTTVRDVYDQQTYEIWARDWRSK